MANSTGTGWKVTGQQQTTGLDESGRATQGVTVSYLTASGVSGSVFVPLTRYTPENVKAEIMDRVARHNAVDALQG